MNAQPTSILKDKNILFLTHNYRSFQKDQIEAIAKYFRTVYVLVRYKPIAEIHRFFPLHSLSTHTRNYAFDMKNKPSNVFVYEIPLWYLPTDRSYKLLGNAHYNGADSIIQKRNIDFDLIHSHFIWSSGYAGMRLKAKYGKPLIITAHGYDIYDLPFRDDIWNRKIREVLTSADSVITVSNRNASLLDSLNVKGKVSVIPNGYDEQSFRPLDKKQCKSDLGLPSNEPIVLSVGNLEKIKGHEYLIKAIKLLINKNIQLRCLIIGDGALRNSLQKLIKSYSLEKHILLLGKKPHSDIPLWLNAADLFILPSINEGNPTVMFESLACGTPFVGTKVGGVSETITDASLGELVEPGNPEALADTIEKLLSKSWNRQTICGYVKQNTWGNIGHRVADVYTKLLSSN